MMSNRIIGTGILAAFYFFYLAKLVLLNRQSIKTNQAGTGNKPEKVLLTERIMSVATVLSVAAAVLSALFAEPMRHPVLWLAGVVTGIAAVMIFAMATVTMKNSWRVGIPEEKTSLVTDGIYSWSRNPAFMGFDLLYLSSCLLFFNIPLVLISVWAAVMLHLQILREEEHMQKMFGAEYEAYRKRTRRYWGKR